MAERERGLQETHENGFRFGESEVRAEVDGGLRQREDIYVISEAGQNDAKAQQVKQDHEPDHKHAALGLRRELGDGINIRDWENQPRADASNDLAGENTEYTRTAIALTAKARRRKERLAGYTASLEGYESDIETLDAVAVLRAFASLR